jgi:hypothetical protein
MVRELDFRLLNLVRQQRGEAALTPAEAENGHNLAPLDEEGGAAVQYELLYDQAKLASPDKR